MGDTWAARLVAVVGPVRSITPLGGGASLVRTGDSTFVAKVGRGIFDEADGLESLRRVRGAPPVPEIVIAESGLLVTKAIARVPRTSDHDASLGRGLAALHAAPLQRWGGGSSWIGACRVDASPRSSAAEFYATRLCELAERCGLEEVVAAVASRLEQLIPRDAPALVHGDLWWGNVLSGSDGRSWVIDPSVHGGHPEEDLAMLALFGQVPDRLLRSYQEVRPLGAGWEERLALFQLYPLLVHAVLFGGAYTAQADAVARRFS
jgi:fructosamine-3-kinase